MRIDLDPEASRLIEERVRSGEYPDAAAVAGAALRLLVERDRDPAVARSRLQGLLRAGLDDFTLGRVTPGPDVFAALRQRAATLRDEESW